MNWFGQKQQKPDIALLTEQNDSAGLIRALTFDDFRVQTAAARALGTLGPEAVGEVIKRLDTRNRTIRLAMIEALAEIRDPRAVDPLLAALSDKDAEVRWGSAIALGEIGDIRAQADLIRALRDPDKYVRYGASFALAKMDWKPDNSTDKALLFYGMQEWGALREMGVSALPVLETARGDRDPGIRIRAIELLGEIAGSEVAPSLIRSLSDENGDVRWKTVQASVKAGVPLLYLPRGISKRPRVRKNPKIAALLNFLLPGQGYNYLGKWWGILIFQFDVTVTLWLLRFGGETLSFTILMPLYFLIAIHAAYIAIKMPDM